MTFACLAAQKVQVRVNAKAMGVPRRGKNVFRAVKLFQRKSVVNLNTNGTKIKKYAIVNVETYCTE